MQTAAANQEINHSIRPHTSRLIHLAEQAANFYADISENLLFFVTPEYQQQLKERADHLRKAAHNARHYV